MYSNGFVVAGVGAMDDAGGAAVRVDLPKEKIGLLNGVEVPDDGVARSLPAGGVTDDDDMLSKKSVLVDDSGRSQVFSPPLHTLRVHHRLVDDHQRRKSKVLQRQQMLRLYSVRNGGR